MSLYRLIKDHFTSRPFKEYYKRERAIYREFFSEASNEKIKKYVKYSNKGEIFSKILFRYIPNIGQGGVLYLFATSNTYEFLVPITFLLLEVEKTLGYFIYKQNMNHLREIVNNRGHYVDEDFLLEGIIFEAEKKYLSEEENE